MTLDIIFLIILIYFVLKGYSRGAIMSLFVSLASLIGFLAASIFSGTVAKLLFNQEADSMFSRVMPFLSYFLVFFAVVFLVKLIAKFSKNLIRKASLSSLDKLLGGVVYFLLVLVMTSVFYWFMNQLHFFSPETMYGSKSFQILEPIAPSLFETFGTVLPFVKSSFIELQDYFDQLNTKFDTYVGAN